MSTMIFRTAILRTAILRTAVLAAAVIACSSSSHGQTANSANPRPSSIATSRSTSTQAIDRLSITNLNTARKQKDTTRTAQNPGQRK